MNRSNVCLSLHHPNLSIFPNPLPQLPSLDLEAIDKYILGDRKSTSQYIHDRDCDWLQESDGES